MPYMLDTNICIYLIQRRPPSVLQRLSQLMQGDAVMSVITYAELRAGLERLQGEQRDRDDQVLQRLIGRIPVLDFGAAGAQQYGVLRAAVPDRRRDALDRLIAAHAVSAGHTLVTNNETDFAGYPGLVVENWVQSPPVSPPADS
jgi:tRNA(fMet)-specific endonuclease VapC